MKYSQEYARILDNSGFPIEWRESAIEYKHLKKLIKNVSKELSSLGLNPAVLNRLLHPPDVSSSPSSSDAGAGGAGLEPGSSPANGGLSSAISPASSEAGPSALPHEHQELEFEFSSDDDQEYGPGSAGGAGVARAGGMASRTWTDEHGKRFRVRVRGEGVAREDVGEVEEMLGSNASSSASETRRRKSGLNEHERVAVRGRFMAEYELAGSSENPLPRLRLVPLASPGGATPMRQPAPQRSSSFPTSNASSPSPPSSRAPSPAPSRPGSPDLNSTPMLTGSSSPAAPSHLLSLIPPLPLPTSPSFRDYDAASSAASELSSVDDDGAGEGDESFSGKGDPAEASEPLMASTPRYFFNSVKSPIWALQAGAGEGLGGITKGKGRATMNGESAAEGGSGGSPPALNLPDAALEGAEASMDVLKLEDEDEDEDEEDEVLPPGFSPALGMSPGRLIPMLAIQPSTPEGAFSYRNGGGKDVVHDAGLDSLDLGEAAIVEETISSAPAASSLPQQEFFIELASDVEFFNVLTHALTTLDKLQRTQQALFRKTVAHLCAAISASANPPAAGLSSSVGGGSKFSKLRPAKFGLGGGDGHSDLYVWREVFTLWIEAEIFESGAERDRGERPIEEAERRLKAFAGEVTKRGLGDRRTLRSRESRAALNTFLQLNLTLLDLKKFQTANIQAARKILKKHDKRTALTASSGFPQFVVSSLTASGSSNLSGDDGNIKTWTLFDASLPHVLLACLTETLLPIIPSLDDYSCLICTSIAFKPIRLDCGHLFCVRCLAKMQRRGKTECPLCRAPVLARASGRNLDMAAMEFMKTYFPREVKVKQKENEREVAQEDAEDLRGNEQCVIM